MFGVLVDVSSSMKSASSNAHAILTVIMKIVKRLEDHERPEDREWCEDHDYVFVGAFGLSGPTVTCDLISLLEDVAHHEDIANHEDIARPDNIAGPEDIANQENIASPEDIQGKDGYQALIDLAKQNGAPQTEPWIRNHLSQFEARILYKRLCSDESLILKLIKLIPQKETIDFAKTVASFFLGVESLNKAAEATMLHWTEAYKFAHEIVELELQRLQQPIPRPVRKVADMLDDLLRSKVSSSTDASAPSSPSPALHNQIEKIILPIKPYIFGNTAMCKALNDTETVFNETNAKTKVLFILSYGSSTDGNPRPFAQKLRDLGVTIVTCFLTSDRIDNPRRLFDKADSNWGDGRSALFEMSSTLPITDAQLSAFDSKWELPPSGETHLFVQANTLDVVNEFCEKCVSRKSEPQ